MGQQRGSSTIFTTKFGKLNSDRSTAADLSILGGVKVDGNAIGKIPYGSSDLSLAAIQWRIENKYFGDSNIASFEYLDAAGNIQTITRSSIPRSKHSEKVIMDELEQQGIPLSNVTRVYSELQPCTLTGAHCENLLRSKVPQAKVTYSFDYQGNSKLDRPLRDQSLAERRSALQQIIDFLNKQ